MANDTRAQIAPIFEALDPADVGNDPGEHDDAIQTPYGPPPIPRSASGQDLIWPRITQQWPQAWGLLPALAGDQAGFAAAQAMAQMLAQTQEDDVVLCLISGGGSALLTLPAEGLSLADLQDTTQALLSVGATINQINTIRKHLSAVKGGGLARLAAPAQVYALILSDVVGDPLEVIASGPTVPDPSTFSDAWAIVEQYALEATLPAPVVQRLQAGLAGDIADTPDHHNRIFNRVTNVVIGDDR